MLPRPFIATEIVVDQTASTSDLARAQVEDRSVELPLLVLARRQTHGRGQGSNLWWSDEGSLTFTVAFDPQPLGLKAHHEPLLALVTALAVIDSIDRYVPATVRLGIRWPNDIEVGDRKLGGVLPERVEVEPRSILLVGVGLNIRTQLDQAPDQVRRMATSLSEFGTAPPIDEVLKELLGRMETGLKKLADNDAGLTDRWAEVDMLFGKPIKVKVGERLLIGVGAGIGPDGALRIAAEDGILTVFGGRVLRN